MYDAIIIGAGPAGSYVARELASRNHRVLVLERRSRLGEKLCAGIVSEECVRYFGIEDSYILKRANRAILFSPSGKTVKLERESTQAAIIDRNAFDSAMAKRAQDSGAEYLLGSLAVNLSLERDGVSVLVDQKNGRTDFKGKVVIVASGFHLHPIYSRSLPKVIDFVYGAQVEAQICGLEDVEIYFGQEKAPGFFAWLIPISSQIARVGLLTRQNPRFYLEKLVLSLKSEGKILTTKGKGGYALVPLKPLSRTYGDRIIVLGDAAGQVKSTTGGGIYYSLLCAEIAVAILHEALIQQDFSAQFLVNYERQWRKKLKIELDVDYYARKFYEKLSDAQIDRIFDIIQTNHIEKALLDSSDVSFDWHSSAILKLMEYRAISKAFELMKLPFFRTESQEKVSS